MKISIQLGKKILDFLAKKHSLDAIICDPPECAYAPEYAYVQANNDVYCIYYCSNNFLCLFQCCNAARLVRKMLQASAQGHDIMCGCRNGATMVILPKYYTLEQLLVEIDLANEIGCQMS